jgi:hypothetical protein
LSFLMISCLDFLLMRFLSSSFFFFSLPFLSIFLDSAHGQLLDNSEFFKNIKIVSFKHYRWQKQAIESGYIVCV